MNLARTAPQEYARVLTERMSGTRATKAVREAIRFLNRAKPLPPLEFSPGMSMGARIHVEDLGPRGGRGHYGRGGSTPFERLNRFGQWTGRAGENIYYGSRDARGVVCALIVDEGVLGRKHRENIFSKDYRVAGVAHGRHSGFGAMCVMNFASGYQEHGSQVAAL
ncbi:MAG: CAP domain-containing protein [Chthoniobacteraceae bacterium]